jgi:hypothetical protein
MRFITAVVYSGNLDSDNIGVTNSTTAHKDSRNLDYLGGKLDD